MWDEKVYDVPVLNGNLTVTIYHTQSYTQRIAKHSKNSWSNLIYIP